MGIQAGAPERPTDAIRSVRVGRQTSSSLSNAWLCRVGDSLGEERLPGLQRIGRQRAHKARIAGAGWPRVVNEVAATSRSPASQGSSCQGARSCRTIAVSTGKPSAALAIRSARSCR